MDLLQILITLAIAALLVVPAGRYIYRVISGAQSRVDPVMDRVDGFIYKLGGIDRKEMTWKQYTVALLLTNLAMCFLVYLIFRIQAGLLLSPGGVKAMEPSLAFNTAISFITNTNLQHYSGEWGVSYFSQMIALTFLMFGGHRLCRRRGLHPGACWEDKDAGQFLRGPGAPNYPYFITAGDWRDVAPGLAGNAPDLCPKSDRYYHRRKTAGGSSGSGGFIGIDQAYWNEWRRFFRGQFRPSL
jgi:hypothetical protein